MLKDRHGKMFECRNFLDLRPVLLKNAYFRSVIDSFPTEYGSWSCAKEKLSIPLEAHDKRSVGRNFSNFLCKNIRELGPAVFRGRLMAFQNRTACVASSKGRQNLESVRPTV